MKISIVDFSNRFRGLRKNLLSSLVILSLTAALIVAFFGWQALRVAALGEQSARLSETVSTLESLKLAVEETAVFPRAIRATDSARESKLWAKRVDAWQNIWNELILDPGTLDESNLEQIDKDLNRLQRSQADLFAASPQSQAKYHEKVELRQERVDRQLTRLTGTQKVELENVISQIKQAKSGFNRNTKLAVLSILLLAAVLGRLIQTQHISPLHRLEDGVRKIAGGQFGHKIELGPGTDIGHLASDLNAVTHNLKRAYDDMTRRFSQLANLYKISKAISTTHDLDELLSIVLKQSLDLMGAESGSIMLLDQNAGELTIRAAEGLKAETIKNTRVKLGEGISGYVASRGKPLMIQDGHRPTGLVGVGPIEDALCVPLMANEEVIGVINANNKRETKFDKDDLRFFSTMAGQIAAATANATLVEDIQKAYFNTIKVLAAAIDAKDQYTYGHSERVAKYAVTIAQQMGLSTMDLTRIEAAAYLHDIGKIGVPDQILNKPESLTEQEFDLVKSHPVKAADILGHIGFPWGDVIPGVRGHHERYDGHGYPDQLAGEEIALDAQIIAVADAFDAMTSDRPYRQALEKTQAVIELVNGRGTQFADKVVDAFVPALLSEWMSSLPTVLVESLEFLTSDAQGEEDQTKPVLPARDLKLS